MAASEQHSQLFSDALLQRVWHDHTKMRPAAPTEAAISQSIPVQLTASTAPPPLPPLSATLATSAVPPAASPVASPIVLASGGRWSTAAVLSCIGVASSITAAVVLYHYRHHPRIQPILEPLLRALHLSSASSSTATAVVKDSQPAAPLALTQPTDVAPTDASSGSLITVDEQQLVRLFHMSLHTLQTTGAIDGELERALARHLQSTAHPSPASPSSLSSSHAALQFVAVQWLLLHCTLQLNGAVSAEQYDALQAEISQTHMPLCWALLATIQSAAPAAAGQSATDAAQTSISQNAVNLLRLDVAQRLHDPKRMVAVFDAVWREKDRGQPWTVEEAVVLCTAAPHIGRWDAMLQLADLIQQAGAGGTGDGLQMFHQSALHRRDIVDYQVVMELARDEMDRRQRASQPHKHTDDEHKEQQPPTTSTSLFPPLPTTPSTLPSQPIPTPIPTPPPTSLSTCTFSHHAVLSLHTLYDGVHCSHPHLQHTAERLQPATSAYTPCALPPAPAVRLARLGSVLALASPLSPRLDCYGLVGWDGWMRLAGWRDGEEGVGGRVRWREEWRLCEVGGGAGGGEGGAGVGMWEGERMVERVRRKYASDVEEEQVRVRWMWKVRLQLQMEPSIS